MSSQSFIFFYPFLSPLSVTSIERGWVVVVDARQCQYRYVKHATSTIKATLGNIRLLLVLRPDGFWDKQRVDCRKTEVDNQVSDLDRGRH